MAKVDKYEVLTQGNIIDDWPCDVNLEGEMESSAGIGHIIEYRGKYYRVITDRTEEEIAKGGFSELSKSEAKRFELSPKKSKMVKCPKCEAEIEHLINTQSGLMDYQMDVTGEYEGEEFETDGITNQWSCPECFETLFFNEEDAIAFLEGK